MRTIASTWTLARQEYARRRRKKHESWHANADPTTRKCDSYVWLALKYVTNVSNACVFFASCRIAPQLLVVSVMIMLAWHRVDAENPWTHLLFLLQRL